jgi:hypothetical protein
MKKVLFVLIPVLLLGGVAALAFMGIINIPGISPKHKVAKNVKGKPADKPPAKVEAPVAVKVTPPPATPPPTPVVKKPAVLLDKVQGAKKLAKLWNEVDSKKLVDLVKDWKDADVATVFIAMDPEKVAEVLGQLEPKRASKISQVLEKQASEVVAEKA